MTARHSSLSPSLFDVALAIYLFGLYVFHWPGKTVLMSQSMWFVFGAFLLWVVSQFVQEERTIRVPILGLVVAWALVISLIHHAEAFQGSFTLRYFDLYVMLAGALHIFSGVLVMKLTAQYTRRPLFLDMIVFLACLNLFLDLWMLADKWRVGLLLTPSQLAFVAALSIPICWRSKPYLALIPLITLLRTHSHSPMAAVLIVSFLIFVMKRQWKLAIIPLGLAMAWMAWRWDNLLLCWQIRPEVWLQTIHDILKHPILGSGFDTSLNAPLIPSSQGYAYRHQDFLAVWLYLGLPGLVFLGAAIWRVLKQTSGWISRWIIGVTVLTMMVQTQMWFPRSMIFVCVLWGWLLTDRKRR